MDTAGIHSMMRRLSALIVMFSLLLLALPRATAAAPPRQASSAGVIAAQAAYSMRGSPYIWGAKGPSAFDCSGLVYWAYQQAGITLGRGTYDQSVAGTQIACNLSDLHGSATTCWKPGDLIFLSYTGGRHVAIYVGNGLFADAYNQTMGIIVHDVAADNYYWSHYWQSRRITDNNSGTVTTPVTPPDGAPSTTPGLEAIPDLLGQVSFPVPQCGSCNADGSTLLPAREWGETWPSGWETLNIALVFQKVISWLSWQVGEYIRQLICWLLWMLGQLAAILATALNYIIAGINGLWKLLVLTWLSLREYFYALWGILEALRDALGGLQWLGEWIAFLWEMILLAFQTIGMILMLLWQLLSIILGLIGWVGGLTLSLIITLIGALGGTTIPTQLSDTHIVYRLVRGGLEAFRDSPIGWIMWLLWGLAYIGALMWASRYFSGGKSA